MADIFNAQKTLSGTIRGASVKLLIANKDVAKATAMVQSVQLQYSRQITRVFELGSDNMYYNIGNSEGQGTIQSIVGPANLVGSALADLGNACNTENTVQFSGGNEMCGGVSGSGSVSVTARGALLQSTSVSLNAQDFMMNSGGQFQFASLEMA